MLSLPLAPAWSPAAPHCSLHLQGKWMPDEDEALRAAVRDLGERWAEVGARVGRIDRVRSAVLASSPSCRAACSNPPRGSRCDLLPESLLPSTAHSAG